MVNSHAPRPRKNRETLHNEDWLREHYLLRMMSIGDIAALLGCSKPSVSWALRKFGIQARSISDGKRGKPNKADWTPEARLRLAEKRKGEVNPFFGRVSEHRSLDFSADPAENARRRVRRSHFGITRSQFDQMAASQNGGCAICHHPERTSGRSGSVRALAVDHDHATGKIRGLLCHRCNVALGYFGDDPALLRAAAAYIEAYGLI